MPSSKSSKSTPTASTTSRNNGSSCYIWRPWTWWVSITSCTKRWKQCYPTGLRARTPKLIRWRRNEKRLCCLRKMPRSSSKLSATKSNWWLKNSKLKFLRKYWVHFQSNISTVSRPPSPSGVSPPKSTTRQLKCNCKHLESKRNKKPNRESWISPSSRSNSRLLISNKKRQNRRSKSSLSTP